MSPTVSECVCGGGNGAETVKEYIRYKLDDFPFTTARKIIHDRCGACGGLTNADKNKEFAEDLAINRAFIQTQDKLYSSDGNLPVVPLAGYTPNSNYHAPQATKEWHEGFIHYLRYQTTGDSVKIVPAIHEYLIYCHQHERLSIAAKQFVKPDDYFKLTSIQ